MRSVAGLIRKSAGLVVEGPAHWNVAIRPRDGEEPSDYAARLAASHIDDTAEPHRRQLGQFFTPVSVARFMAALVHPARSVRRLLDPGAGTGILACALCEALPANAGGPVHVDAYEVDDVLAPLCTASLSYAREFVAKRGVTLSFTVHRSDFVTGNARLLSPGLFDAEPSGFYDVAIANPPYFKLQKDDPRARATASVVHGQPNIYALFLALMARLLVDQGAMVTITPRSFTTGDYFRRFREDLFRQVIPEAVHLFHSRKDAFRRDAVLQENVILKCRKRRPSPSAAVVISTSHGASDLDRPTRRRVGLASVVDLNSSALTVHIPADDADDEVAGFVRSWPLNLHRLGLEVSTGPVVAFRANRFLRSEARRGEIHVPLLWLQHIRPMIVSWPLRTCTKPQHIHNCPESRRLLVPNATYVLLRRFTAKEERRRLTATPLGRAELPGSWIGLENHLNYVHRPGGSGLDDDEAIGLAALLGTALLDRYVRISSGTTQVNAAELRRLPLPEQTHLVELGRQVRTNGWKSNELDAAVMEFLGVPPTILARIKA